VTVMRERKERPSRKTCFSQRKRGRASKLHEDWTNRLMTKNAEPFEERERKTKKKFPREKI